MSSKVQVSMAFLEGVRHLIDELRGHPLDKSTLLLCRALEDELDAKERALERRRIFSEYKSTAPGSEERERARQAHLDESNIHKDWRSSKETPSSP